MKNNNKFLNFFKRNAFGIFIGIFISTPIYVLSASYINSNIVLYSNKKTTANNVSSAVDELYNLATTGNAVASNILSSKTALVGGKLLTGSMPNKGSWKLSPIASGKITVPAGYHDGTGYVDASGIYKELSADPVLKTHKDSSGNEIYKNVVDKTSLINAIEKETSKSNSEAVVGDLVYASASDYPLRDSDYGGAWGILMNQPNGYVYCNYMNKNYVNGKVYYVIANFTTSSNNQPSDWLATPKGVGCHVLSFDINKKGTSGSFQVVFKAKVVITDASTNTIAIQLLNRNLASGHGIVDSYSSPIMVYETNETADLTNLVSTSTRSYSSIVNNTSYTVEYPYNIRPKKILFEGGYDVNESSGLTRTIYNFEYDMVNNKLISSSATRSYYSYYTYTWDSGKLANPGVLVTYNDSNKTFTWKMTGISTTP